MTRWKLGRNDQLRLGQYNAICDACGRKFKDSQLTKRWDGLMVCAQDWEPRQPQDFVRGISDPAPIPWSRPKVAADFGPADFCTPDDTCAVSGMAIPGCVIPGYVNPANTRGL